MAVCNNGCHGIADADVVKEVTSPDGKVKWTGAYQYYTEDGSAVPIPISYRVVETMYNESGGVIATAVVPYTTAGGGFTRMTKLKRVQRGSQIP